MDETPALLCLGYGYTARALARRLMARGWRVFGTFRRPDQAAGIEATGAEPVPWPPARCGPLLDLARHVLVSIPPDEAGDPVLRHCAGALSARAEEIEWLGYLSTTAVYGDRAGGWVEETSECRPASARGARRLAAERDWLLLWEEFGLPVHIFRLAGIYGPGRGPFEKLRRGTARRIVKPGQVFGRIHVEDIATVLEASIDRPHPGAIYNVTDDEPAPPEAVIEYAAELLGLPAPPEEPFEEAEMSEMARSFYGESKRVSNARIKKELGVSLAYPTYREGLKAILEAEKAHSSKRAR